MSRFDKEARNWDTPQKQERAQTIADAIRSKVSLSGHDSALEYGCGTGQLSFELREHVGHITLADNSEGMLDVLQEKIISRSANDMEAVKLDFITDPLPDKRFDLIYTLMTLHHIADTKAILDHFYTLLNSGGTLCVADLDKEDGSFHGHDVDDVHRGFDREALSALAQECGFANITFSTAYTMEKEIAGEGKTCQFPLFLMVAEKR